MRYRDCEMRPTERLKSFAADFVGACFLLALIPVAYAAAAAGIVCDWIDYGGN
jgi:hypothetical protein